MSTPVQIFQQHFRFEQERSKAGLLVYVTRRNLEGSVGIPGVERNVAATALLVLSREDLLIKDLTTNPSCLLGQDDDLEEGDLKSLRNIYSRRFPMLYAAAMAAALSRAYHYGCNKVRGYLSAEEVRILPRLFPLSCCGGREYSGYTARILERAAQSMPVFHELIVLASEQLEG